MVPTPAVYLEDPGGSATAFGGGAHILVAILSSECHAAFLTPQTTELVCSSYLCFTNSETNVYKLRWEMEKRNPIPSETDGTHKITWKTLIPIAKLSPRLIN